MRQVATKKDQRGITISFLMDEEAAKQHLELLRKHEEGLRKQIEASTRQLQHIEQERQALEQILERPVV